MKTESKRSPKMRSRSLIQALQMRKLLLVLLLSTQAFAQGAYVASNSNIGASTTTVAVSLAITVGQLIPVSIACNAAAGRDFTSVTDDGASGGNTYNFVSFQATSNAAQGWLLQAVATKSATTVTVVMNGTCTNPSVIAGKYTGLTAGTLNHTGGATSTLPNVDAPVGTAATSWVIGGLVSAGSATYSQHSGTPPPTIRASTSTGVGNALVDGIDIQLKADLSSSEVWSGFCGDFPLANNDSSPLIF